MGATNYNTTHRVGGAAERNTRQLPGRFLAVSAVYIHRSVLELMYAAENAVKRSGSCLLLRSAAPCLQVLQVR